MTVVVSEVNATVDPAVLGFDVLAAGVVVEIDVLDIVDVVGPKVLVD
jgi:hypothetical protein